VIKDRGGVSEDDETVELGRRPQVIVVADASGEVSHLLAQSLLDRSHTVVRVDTASRALETLNVRAADLLLADSRLPDRDGLELLRTVQRRWPGMPVVLAIDDVAVPEVIDIVGSGPYEALTRPVSPAQLALAIHRALVVARRTAAAPPPPAPSDAGLVFGQSPLMAALRKLLQQVAPTSSTVLVRGESGTGKELVARCLHRMSTRAMRPFVKIDCTSLPENLIESELFGYEKGAFTGAAAQKLGRVQLADTGTLFLDEIGELPGSTQAKLLRLLQDREFERLGGRKTIGVDVRVVAATHRDLDAMVEGREFRQDLFYRLNVVPIWIAPLRARRTDIQELAVHFCARVAAENSKPGVTLSAEALRALASQRWPGNVRQLQNFVERLVVLSAGPVISEGDVLAELARPVRFVTQAGTAGADAGGGPPPSGQVQPLAAAVRAAERHALLRALNCTGGNRSEAARLLGVSRSTLYAKLDEYGLS
jgi:two-component system, NtrC family, response regulator AtoC